MKIEFARRSQDGRMTLVLTKKGSPVRSLWALMDCTKTEDAREALRAREGVPKNRLDKFIGSLKRGDNAPETLPEAPVWLEHQQLDAVVWTALPPKFDDDEMVPTELQVLDYLGGLRGAERENAERYVRRAPAQIDTNYRRAIEARLGWTAMP